MDNKTIFVKTSKGEDEMHSRTSHLPGDDKRALLMVDGTSTFGEIMKRAAPSMRASLGETFRELEKTGFIQDKDMIGKIPKIAKPPKMSVPVKMSVPRGKTGTPQKKQPEEEEAGELDFMSGFTPSVPGAPKAGAGKAEKVKAEAEERSEQQTEAEKVKAQREAKAILLQAEQEAARIREETMRRANEEAEATRLKAEQEARKLREGPGNANLKNDQDARQRLEAAIREQKQSAESSRSLKDRQAGKGREEPVKLSHEQEARLRLEAAIREQKLAADASGSLTDKQAIMDRDELEAARLKIELESKQRLEAVAREREKAEAARIKAEQEAARIQIETEMAKLKVEQEAKARLEAEARALARIRAEEEAARARQAAELSARQEREEAAREAAARAAEAREAAARAAKSIEESSAAGADNFALDEFAVDDFQFDEFKLEEPQDLAVPRKDRHPAQKSGPAQRPGAAEEKSRAADVASREQIEREEQQRIAAEEEQKRIAAEAQAREMADAQARILAEEQRALEAAKTKAKQPVHHAEHVEKPVRVARPRRKPFAWGKLVGFVFKLGVILLVLLVGALFIIPYVLPMRDYMPKVQQQLSARLHQPVHLGNLSGRILPMPRLELGEIYIGDAKQFQAVDAQINFDLMALFTDIKPISSVEFHGVKVRGPWVRNVAQWLQLLANDNQYPVSRMVINQGTLDAEAFQLTGVEGEMDFNPDGKFTQANLRANGGKYSMVLDPVLENKLQTSITVRGSALPMLPNWPFDELVAKGELSNDGLLIRNFDARILGGIVKGDATINWHSGWHAQGNLSAKAIVMKNLSKLLDGNIEGTARFNMNSMELAGLTDSAVLDGSFKSSDGLISGLEIVETARMHSKENLPGGRTHFDQLGGEISYANDTYHYKQVKLDAGVMDATATFDVTKQQLSGKMSVKLSIQDKAAPVSLKMGGSIDSPTLVYAP
jgi:hypothetical protein